MDCKDGAHSRGSLTGDRSRFSRHDHLFLSPFPEKKELLRILDKRSSLRRLASQNYFARISKRRRTLLHNVLASGAQEFLRNHEYARWGSWPCLRDVLRCCSRGRWIR